jgi:hypothetical protein
MPKAAKTIRPRKSREQVDEEFQQIKQESALARETAGGKAAEAAKLREAEVRSVAEGLTVEGVVSGISSLGLEMARALASISEKLTVEVERLQAARDAVELERSELSRLHKIDVAATSLDDLLAQHEREKERLDADIMARRAEWQEEVRSAERERKEQEETLKRQRQRENDEYEYKKQQERKKAQDKFDEELRQQERKNQEKQEALEKSWTIREAALKEQEQELARLRKENAEFPARLQKEIEKAVSDAVRTAQARFEQDVLLSKKDAESDRRLADLQVKTLEETVKHQASQIDTLEKQLAEAKQQVQDIAVKAIEGASGARALSHVNQIAMEQAKQRNPQA